MGSRPIIEAEAWGVVVDGKLDVRTVSPHVRGAMVNYLMAGVRIAITDRMNDEAIYDLWDKHHGAARVLPVRCVVVTRR